ncbi:hypothetical protein LNAOJCKE_1038 [Methylorubrum aminovorans]|uniref:Uncharacterized protein n=1 Tax=Methylorubrum aminovorans TaxID=269069 RepID=A0ABQ4UCF5_9HYPH|nr:hypothetical protein LNAOJCKE_1038 [Methylorubrum aminovorans]GMA78437.1 hypothetical protein GCM10025880_48540 [Methylorubrum aminovorans]
MPRLELGLTIRHNTEGKPLCPHFPQNRPHPAERLCESRAVSAVVRKQDVSVLGPPTELIQYARIDYGLMDVSAPVQDEEPGAPLGWLNLAQMIGVPLELVSQERLEGGSAIQQSFVQVEENSVDHSFVALLPVTAISLQDGW